MVVKLIQQLILDMKEDLINTIFDIGPESENFFYLKPFVGIETYN